MTRVWVTRDEPRDGPLGAALREAGLEPVHEPVLRREPLPGASDFPTDEVAAGHWLMLTSAFALSCIDLARCAALRVAAVGPATASAARACGLDVALTADGGVERLLHALRAQVNRGVIWYPRSDLAASPGPWAEVEIRSAAVYRTTERPFDRTVVQRVNVVTVTSPSAVRAAAPIVRPLACLGASTAAAARSAGAQPWLVSPSTDFPAFAREIAVRVNTQ